MSVSRTVSETFSVKE